MEKKNRKNVQFLRQIQDDKTGHGALSFEWVSTSLVLNTLSNKHAQACLGLTLAGKMARLFCNNSDPLYMSLAFRLENKGYTQSRIISTIIFNTIMLLLKITLHLSIAMRQKHNVRRSETNFLIFINIIINNLPPTKFTRRE